MNTFIRAVVGSWCLILSAGRLGAKSQLRNSELFRWLLLGVLAFAWWGFEAVHFPCYAQSRPHPPGHEPNPAPSQSPLSPSPRWVGPFKSREDNGPFTKIVLRNDLHLLIKEHHATPLASVTVLVTIPDQAPSIESEMKLRLAAEMIFTSVEQPEAESLNNRVSALGAVTRSRVLPDKIEWTATVSAQQLPKLYPFIVQGLTATEVSQAAVESLSKSLVPARKSKGTDMFGREEFILTGYAPTLGPRPPITPKMVQDLNHFVKQTLEGSHIVLAIVGDVDREKVIQQVADRFLSLPGGEPKRNPKLSMAKRDDKLEYKLLPTTEGQAGLTVFFPAASLPPATLFVLSSFLTNGRMSFLGQSLVYRYPFVSAMDAHLVHLGPNPFFKIHFDCRPDHLDAAVAFLFARLQQLSDTTPNDDELLRARQQFALGWHLANRSPETISQRLAEFDLALGYQTYVKLLVDSESVTKEELHRTVTALFSLQHAMVVEHWPQHLLSRSFSSETYRDFLGLTLRRAANKLGKGMERATANLPVVPNRTPPYVGNFDRSQLKPLPWSEYSILRGPKVYVSEFHLSPLVTIEALFPGGQLFESKEHAGLTALTVASAIQAIKDKPHDEVWYELEFLGAQIAPILENDLFGYELTAPPSTALLAINILNSMLLEPQFSPESVAAAKDQLIETLTAQRQSSTEFASDKVKTSFFSHTSFYASLDDRVATLRKATERNVVAWWNHIQKDRLPFLMIMGDTEGTELVEPFARKWSSSTLARSELDPIASMKIPKLPATIQVSSSDIAIPVLALGFGGPNFASTDTFAFEAAPWLFKDLFDRVQVEEFHYLRYFEGLSNEVPGSSSALAAQVLNRMSALIADEKALSAAGMMANTGRELRLLDPRLKALDLFRRSQYAANLEAVVSAENAGTQMSVSQLKTTLSSIFSSQNVLACFLTPATSH